MKNTALPAILTAVFLVVAGVFLILWRLEDLALEEADAHSSRPPIQFGSGSGPATPRDLVFPDEPEPPPEPEPVPEEEETSETASPVPTDEPDETPPAYTSALRSEVKHDEVLVTGGFRMADGRYCFSFLQPALVTRDNGNSAIVLGARRLFLTSEAANRTGINSLITDQNAVLQHGEVWTLDEMQAVMKNLSAGEGAELISAPKITTLPGAAATVHVGGYQLHATANLLEDGSGFDIEMQIQEPADEPSGQ